jgi:superfamily II DNA or RNA helicase
MVKWTGIVHVIKYTGHPDYTKEKLSALGYMSAGATNQQVTEDPSRQYLVVKIILDLVRRDRDMFIFCEQIRQIDSLLELSRSDEFADDFANIIITKLVGGQKEAANAVAKCGQVIVVSFSFGSESISIPRKNSIVYYTSRKTKQNQKLGRILRLGGDPSICREIYDIVDVSTGLKKQFSDRKKEYVKKGFPIMIHEMSHEDTCWPPKREPKLMKGVICIKPKKVLASAAEPEPDAESDSCFEYLDTSF